MGEGYKFAIKIIATVISGIVVITLFSQSYYRMQFNNPVWVVNNQYLKCMERATQGGIDTKECLDFVLKSNAYK